MLISTMKAIACEFGFRLECLEFDGTGRMSPNTWVIQINPHAIEDEVKEALDSNDLMARVMPVVEESASILGYYTTITDRAENLDAIGTVCHEIAHGTEGLSTEQITLLYGSLQGPEALKQYLDNHCRDVRDQGHFSKKYPGKWFRLGLKFMQEATQGDVQSYKKSLDNPKLDSIQRALWYFILRGWNELNPEIASLFGHHPALPWKPDTLQAFDDAVHAASNEGYMVRFKTLYPLVLRDLRAQTQELPKGDGDGPQGGTPGDPGQNPQGQAPSTAETKIEEAATKLLSLINANKGISKELQKALQTLADSNGKGILMAASNMKAWPLRSAPSQPLPEWSMELYNNCMAWWGQLLLTPARETQRRLMSGELDEARCEQWVLERDLRIFQRDHWNRQERNVLIHFALDESGSMRGQRSKLAQPLVAALAHAFEMSGFRTEVLLFSSACAIIKNPEEQGFLNGRRSDILGAIATYGRGLGGGTQPTPLFDWLYDMSFTSDDIDHVLFYITDGQIGDSDSRSVQKVVQNLTATGRWQVKALAIDFNTSELKSLASRVAPGEVWTYRTDEISTKLGVDIYNFFTEEFISLDE